MDSSNSVVAAERDCNALGGLFSIILNDLKGGANNWDDLLVKANKFHMQLKSTITASTAFLDAFQKIADLATTTRSGTKEIGSALTRLCLRHRSVEAKLKSFTNSMQDSFILPLQDRVEEWKRIIATLDKDHSKELKRLKALRKKQATADGRSAGGASFGNTTFRIKRNPRSKALKTSQEMSRIGSMYDINRLFEQQSALEASKEKYYMLEEVERNYVRRALIEERSHYCLFFNFLRPVVEEEISMLQEVTHLEEVLSALIDLTMDPYQLPAASESLLSKMISESATSQSDFFSYGDTSPCSTLHRSRKSSISSITSINSLSTDSFSLQNCKSLSQPNITPEFRPKSIASQDSGFISHDYNVPNVSRLIISNKIKGISETASLHSGTSAHKTMLANCTKSLNGTLSGKANSRKSIASCRLGCFEGGEYASTDQIHAAAGTLPKTGEHQQLAAQNGNGGSIIYSADKSQPIYANITDDYAANMQQQQQQLSNSQSMNNCSDGSITPTNHPTNGAALNGCSPDEDEDDGDVRQGIYRESTATGLMRPTYQQQHSATGANGSNGCSALDAPPPKPSRPKMTNPPKPPLRLTSTLSSTGTLKPPPKTNGANSTPKSTRIYVMQPDANNSLDFPPPPPEAYVNYATPSNGCNNGVTDHRLVVTAATDQLNNNAVAVNRSAGASNGSSNAVSCCDYSLASSHLVLCNDINCLKGMQHQYNGGGVATSEYAAADNRKSMALSEAQYAIYRPPNHNFSTLTGSARKSYAFEAAAPGTMNSPHSTAACDPQTPIYSECSALNLAHQQQHHHPHHQQHSQYVKPFCEPDRARSVPPSRRFHSTINLSHQQ